MCRLVSLPCLTYAAAPRSSGVGLAFYLSPRCLARREPKGAAERLALVVLVTALACNCVSSPSHAGASNLATVFPDYQLAAPLGASLAIAIRRARPQGCEGPRSDATIASDPVAPSHFRRPTAASVSITGAQIPNDRIQRRDPRDRKGPSAPCRCGNARDDRQRVARRAG